MKLIDLVKLLKEQGIDVKYRKRGEKEGKGIRITSINGNKFYGSTGNLEAQKMLKISLPKGAPRKQALPTDIKKELTRAQRKFRKSGTKAGKPSTKNVRYNLEHKGEEETLRLLSQSERYASGLAYTENIDHLIDRLKKDSERLLMRGDYDEMSALDRAIAKIEANKEKLTENQLKEILNTTYEAEKRKGIKWKTFEARVNNILNK